MFFKHLRITLSKETASKLIPLFIEKFKPDVYIFAYEEVGENKHIHAHLEYKDKEPSKSTLSDWFKKENLSGKYYCKTLDKEPINNKLYVVKDLDILNTNITEEELEELRQKTADIEEDKAKDIKVKLVERIKKKIQADEMTISSSGIAEAITDIYVDEWDKLPPPYGLQQQYTVYIMKKLMNDESIVIQERNYLREQYRNFHQRFHIRDNTEETINRDSMKELISLISKIKNI